MTLQEQLMEDMKTAMKAHETMRLDVIRMIRAAVKNYEIDHGVADDAKVQNIISTMVKQQQDALKDFERAARQDLIDEAKANIEILAAYLPAQLSDEELETAVKEVLAQASTKDFGPLMGQVMKRVQGKADGTRVTQVLKALLAA
jgi:uncharacterized protein YqeY